MFETWGTPRLVALHVTMLAFTLLLAFAVACSDGDDDDPQQGAGAGGDHNGMLTDGEADACERDCDAQVAAGCERTPANHAESCKLFCQALRESTPEACQASLRAQSQCALEHANYGCQGGLPVPMTQGACAREAAACAACRGSLCIVGL